MPDDVPKRWLCEYMASSHVSIPVAQRTLSYAHPTGRYEAHIENAAPEAPDHNLRLFIVAPAPTMGEAIVATREAANDFTRLMSLVTQLPFRIVAAKRLVDWSPGVKNRSACIFFRRPPSGVVGELSSAFMDTAQALAAAGVDDLTAQAMRWYADGTAATGTKDQFQYFWFAIETLARSMPASPQSHNCKSCGADLKCASCSHAATYDLSLNQRLKQFLIGLDMSDDMAKHFIDFRNRALHGATLDALEAHAAKVAPDEGFEAVVNALGDAAWHAIMRSVPLADEQRRDLTFGFAESYSSFTLKLRLELVVQYPGDPDKPSMDDLHRINVQASTVELDEGGREIRTQLR